MLDEAVKKKPIWRSGIRRMADYSPRGKRTLMKHIYQRDPGESSTRGDANSLRP